MIYFVFKKLVTIKDERLELLNELVNEMNKIMSSIGNGKITRVEFSESLLVDSDRVEYEFINDYQTYLKKITEYNGCDNIGRYLYRGHSKVNYQLKPSLFRNKNFVENEVEMIEEMLVNCSHEFTDCHNQFEILVKLQHYGLPTRLLDVTENPLVALYFAAEQSEESYGEVILFKKNNKVVYEFDESIQNFRIEHMEKCVNLNHRVIKPRRTNERIRNQEGLFIYVSDLSGTERTLEDDRYKKNGKVQLLIIKDKKTILNELAMIGINKAKMYPEIDEVASHIKNKYSN